MDAISLLVVTALGASVVVFVIMPFSNAQLTAGFAYAAICALSARVLASSPVTAGEPAFLYRMERICSCVTLPPMFVPSEMPFAIAHVLPAAYHCVPSACTAGLPA